MLARASFQNFKALKAVEIDLAPFTVLVGENGSGKSSVLQAIFDLSRVAVLLSSGPGAPCALAVSLLLSCGWRSRCVGLGEHWSLGSRRGAARWRSRFCFGLGPVPAPVPAPFHRLDR